mgnify:CR=1 FL=1
MKNSSLFNINILWLNAEYKNNYEDNDEIQIIYTSLWYIKKFYDLKRIEIINMIFSYNILEKSFN